MNKAKLKTYAPAARRDFIQAVTQRANLLGLSATGIDSVQITGDIAMINGRPWPAKVAQQRELLVARIKRQGFDAVMEAEAYGWFNRFAALRFMELHGYLDHGYRVLSNPTGVLPEMLENAASLDSVALPGLNRDEVIRLKLDGDKDNELYRLLLTTQCNALASSMGFLFETLDDETELLLPDNLLNTDSVIAKLVEAIPEEDWAEVEIIGWLYQFYISEKKDQVIGKVVKSEDIPAATQLFTPNWIVQYLVQNSVGRLWLMANPQSTLAQQWPYYITPAEQTPEVQAQLDAVIQTRVREDGDTLNPESITVLDPACGSGHILVVAYDVLKSIYLERGYQPRAIPRLILEKNLFGLDIDDRAAQMAGFALLMKARADDRRLFSEPIELNVLALQESKGLDADGLTRALQTVAGRVSPQTDASVSAGGFSDDDLFPGTRPQISLGESIAADMKGDPARPAIAALIATFAHAKTFGSLIQIPQTLIGQLSALAEHLRSALQNGDLYAKAAAQDLWPLVVQARVLGMQFDAVAANPPYMGGLANIAGLREFAEKNFPRSKSDMFAMFIDRGFHACRKSGVNSMVAMQSWLFQSGYEAFRIELLRKHCINSLVQIGFNSFPEMNSKVAQAAAFSISKGYLDDHRGTYVRLISDDLTADKDAAFLNRMPEKQYAVPQTSFSLAPGSVIAYWIPANAINAYKEKKVADYCELRTGLIAGNNERFIRYWFEVDCSMIKRDCRSISEAIDSTEKWFPLYKGGDRRKWYGNLLEIVDFQAGGVNIRAEKKSMLRNEREYFKPGIHWNRLSQGNFSARISESGCIFEDLSPTCFPKLVPTSYVIGFLNSAVGRLYESATSTGWKTELGSVGNFPLRLEASESICTLVDEIVSIAKEDWSRAETSMDYVRVPLVRKCVSIADDFMSMKAEFERQVSRAVKIESEINSLFIRMYGLESSLSPNVAKKTVALFANTAHRYGAQECSSEYTRLERQSSAKELVSFSVGCMMGRYSLDEPSLIYAHTGNLGFEPGRYSTFPADADGIVPITDELWFADDACSRIREFLSAAWGPDTLEENMAWLAESLGQKPTETPDETIRRYIADKFFKDHLQTYKKRPIYWLFSSGKQKAFECLVYLHRYNEGTLARMRNEYVIPLAGKFGGRADLLQNLITAASTTSERTKLQKELDNLKKKQLELNQFDEQLRHYADQRISLDLDDGVKVNYGKFGNLLAEVKAITGGNDDD